MAGTQYTLHGCCPLQGALFRELQLNRVQLEKLVPWTVEPDGMIQPQKLIGSVELDTSRTIN